MVLPFGAASPLKVSQDTSSLPCRRLDSRYVP